VNSFDIGALACAICASVIFSKYRRDSLFVAALLGFHGIVSVIDITEFNQFYYLIIAMINSLFILNAVLLKINRYLVVTLLLITLYNVVSYLEYDTPFYLIYDFYQIVMQLLISSLILIIYGKGIYDSLSIDHIDDCNSDNSNSQFYCGDLL